MSSLHEDIRIHARQTSLSWGDLGHILTLDSVSALALAYTMPGCEIEAISLKLGIFPERYLRNGQSINATNQTRLLESHIAQVGLGGLGGTLLEHFLRLGVGHIRAADGDAFEPSNLNRQALSNISNLGQFKAHAAELRATEINPSTVLETTSEFLTPDSFPEFLADCDLVVDALGGLTMRRHLQQAATQSNIPLVTGALAGWTGYVSVVLPGQIGPADIMGTDNGAEESLGCPAPAVSLIASIMASETVNILSGATTLAGKMLIVDLHSHSFETIIL